ncbi:MAG: hypothetical protein ACRENE_34040, partial [Polyangiaceae bacterium]
MSTKLLSLLLASAGLAIASQASASSAGFGTFAGTPSGCQPTNASIHMVKTGAGMTGSIVVQPIYIGTPASSSPASVQTWNQNFLQSGVFSSQMGWLTEEFGVGTIATVNSDLVISNPQTFTTSTSLNGNNYGAELAWQIAHSGAPNSAHFPTTLAPASTIFVIYVSNPYKDGGACNPFNGYNTTSNQSGQTYHLGVIFDETDNNAGSVYQGCFNSSNTQVAVETRNTTKPGVGLSRPSGAAVLQHEIVEVLTNNWSFENPPPNTDCGQIADPCQFNTDISYSASGQTYAIQSMWSNTANRCVTGTRGASADIMGNGTSDIAFGHTGNATFDVAVPSSSTYGVFNLSSLVLNNGYDSNGNPTAFSGWETQGVPVPLVGDFDGDGFADVAMTGGSYQGTAWGSIPVAYSNGTQLNVTNSTISGQPFGTFAT